MKQIFQIAPSEKLGDYNVVGDKSEVSEQLFNQTLASKIKELTKDQIEKFDETMQKAQEALKSSSLTVIDTWFKITNRK